MRLNSNLHANIFETKIKGKVSFRLLCKDEVLGKLFDHWSFSLTNKYAFQTTKTYSYAVCYFLNYFIEMTHENDSLTPIFLYEIFENYESFLAFGKDSEIEIIANAAINLKSRSLSGSSIETHFSAVNLFIDASESMRIGMLQLEERGYLSEGATSTTSLVLSAYENSPYNLKAAIKKNSWLAGCISGGYKKLKRRKLKLKSKPKLIARTNDYGGDELTFPIDLCSQLIYSTNCLRDRTLWSLIAATGIRISEALSIFTTDIKYSPDLSKKPEVEIISPESRFDVLKKYLTQSDISKLSHKGRIYPNTFLIEPFASIFWQSLADYTEQENLKEKRTGFTSRHPFLFRNLKSGSPLISSYVSLLERFQKASRSVTGETYGFHSLRHMYAYYLCNYCPNPNPTKEKPFGLDISLVQKYMGHASLATTKRYARTDLDLLNATIATANMLRVSCDSFTIMDIQIKYVERQLAAMKEKRDSLFLKNKEVAQL